MTKLLSLHLVNFTEFRPFYVRYYSVSIWVFSDLKDVRSNFLTLVVQSTISFILFLLHKLLQQGLALISLGKCGSLLIKMTLTELSISNLRHAFTLNQRITLSYAERSSHTKQIPSRCLRFTKCLSNLNLLVSRSSSGKTIKIL